MIERSDLDCKICNSISLHLLSMQFFLSVSHILSPLRDSKSDLVHSICNVLFSIPLKLQLVICFILCVIGRDPTWMYNICILNLSSLLIIVCSPGVRSILEILDYWSISGSGKHVLVQLKLNTYRLSVDLAAQFRWTTISLVVVS